MASESWRAALLKSLKKNSSLPNARYVQLATIREDGRPANRTVVFRGFLGDSEKLTFITDSRSDKVSQIAKSPFAEIAWYLPITREQFRLSGELTVVGKDYPDPQLLQARESTWRALSDPARSQFSWPHPGLPRLEHDALWSPVPVTNTQPPTDPFCLVVMAVDAVDYLSLKANKRHVYSKVVVDGQETGEWRKEEVNP